MSRLDAFWPLAYSARVPDVFTKAKRSQVMAAIRSRGNKATELKLLAILRGGHITGWRRHLALPGRPDFAFPRARLAIFVDGCFWHGCPQHGRRPTSNRAYWLPKLERNRKRDATVSHLLRSAGWRVLRIWAHALAEPQAVIETIRTELKHTPIACKHSRSNK